MAGEFTGNVNWYLDCDASLEPIVQKCLSLQDPGRDTSVEFLSSGGPDDGVMLGFHSEAIEFLAELPEHLDLLWCGEPLGSVRTALQQSVPLEEVHRLLDPSEIMPRRALPSSNPYRLGAERMRLWLLPSLIVVTIGHALCFEDLGFRTSQISLVRWAGCALVYGEPRSPSLGLVCRNVKSSSTATATATGARFCS
ncbi:MAG: hypothetical protein CL933_25235 [Deltaproteobacteria bacterium]|nr:hypothetical protein [Deltaproteobacteria bacterium]